MGGGQCGEDDRWRRREIYEAPRMQILQNEAVVSFLMLGRIWRKIIERDPACATILRRPSCFNESMRLVTRR